jgi:hypothetical protein
MSTRSSWDDAEIHAYVDGVLDADTSVRIEAASREDPVLAGRIARQRELRTRLGAEFDLVLQEPIPPPLLEALTRPGAESVTPIGAARKPRIGAPRPAWSLREWGAVAATLVLGAILGHLVFRGSSQLPIETEQGRLVAAGYLDRALSTQVAGTAPENAAARIGLTLHAADGQYCRTFTLQTGESGLACRRDHRWSVEVLEGAAAQPTAPGGFRQASSALSPAMLGAITALDAGDPLTADEERQRLRSGWDAAGR